MGSGIQTTVKANELCSIMVVYRHGVHNRIIAYMLQIGESTIYRIFVVWVDFVVTIFSCLNLKPNDGILLDSMPEVFNKTGHGLTNIKIPELNLNQCCTQSFLGIMVHISVES